MNERALISGEALKSAARDYAAQIEAAPAQSRGVFDKWFMRAFARLMVFDPQRDWEESVAKEITQMPAAEARGLEWDFLRLRLFLDRWRQGRFVSYAQREASGANYVPKYGTEFGAEVLLTCQGAGALPHWRGLPLMKTVFDLALYPQLLAELRPRTVFEIGSGAGASALWLADHLRLLGLTGHVHSVDIEPVQNKDPNVTFYRGDCRNPESLFGAELLSSAPHPWLAIEDAHINVEGVLGYFHPFLKQGDYLYVEDSEIKREILRRFLATHPGCYQVDTKYTDFFGRNATCALDSIFIRTASTP